MPGLPKYGQALLQQTRKAVLAFPQLATTQGMPVLRVPGWGICAPFSMDGLPSTGQKALGCLAIKAQTPLPVGSVVPG